MEDSRPRPAELPAERYRCAEQRLEHIWKTQVVDVKVKPHWMDAGSGFWFRSGPQSHPSFFLVDPESGTRKPAFDHQRLADALAQASGSPVDADCLPFASIRLEHESVRFDAFGHHWACDLQSYAVTREAGPESADPMEVRSPDGKWAVTLREHNLWLRSTADNEERALTNDGTADCAYAIQPDNLSFGVLMRKLGLRSLPPLVTWSPDSRYLLTHRTDQREVMSAHLIESSPEGGGRSKLHTYRYPFPGDARTAKGQLVLFGAASGQEIPVRAEPIFMPLISPVLVNWAWWDKGEPIAYYLEHTRDMRTLSLRAIDARTGEVRRLVEESGDPRVEPGQQMAQRIVEVLTGGREILWYSQRDGWGHLYLYQAGDGGGGRQLTSGNWCVQEILHVDEDSRIVYFLASGLIEEDPYRRQVCKVGLDGEGFACLSDDSLDHSVTVADGGGYYLDAASTREQPPVIAARDWTGRELVEVARTDVSRLEASGWRAPQPFRATAADGVTDVYGVLYLPPDFDPAKRYPVIDHLYPGPQHGRYVAAFGGGDSFGRPLDRDAEAVAALGFVVLAMDGRGLPGRSREFHDISYGRLDSAGFLEDHVAALHELAETRSWLDLDRVGAFGASGGGYATVRALCLYPDLYKVGVAQCGNHDQRYYQLAWGEVYDGPLDEDRYVASSNVDLADRLEGKLLLIHGEMDDNVHPHLTMRLVDRLVALDKDFEMLIIPGAEHTFVGFEAFVQRRRWDFLVRHLMRLEPPSGFRLAPVPVDAESILEAMG